MCNYIRLLFVRLISRSYATLHFASCRPWRTTRRKIKPLTIGLLVVRNHLRRQHQQNHLRPTTKTMAIRSLLLNRPLRRSKTNNQLQQDRSPIRALRLLSTTPHHPRYLPLLISRRRRSRPCLQDLLLSIPKEHSRMLVPALPRRVTTLQLITLLVLPNLPLTSAPSSILPMTLKIPHYVTSRVSLRSLLTCLLHLEVNNKGSYLQPKSLDSSQSKQHRSLPRVSKPTTWQPLLRPLLLLLLSLPLLQHQLGISWRWTTSNAFSFELNAPPQDFSIRLPNDHLRLDLMSSLPPPNLNVLISRVSNFFTMLETLLL